MGLFMNYQEMSDKEINLEVLRIFHPDIEHMCMSESGEYFYHCGPDGNGFYQIDVIDYCNSWADAGPIAHRNKINLYFSNNENMAEHRQTGKKSITCTDYNPLRAAMIVFLMMKGGE